MAKRRGDLVLQDFAGQYIFQLSWLVSVRGTQEFRRWEDADGKGPLILVKEFQSDGKVWFS